MNKNSLARQIVVAFGFLFLYAAPGLSGEQSAPPVATPPSRMAPRAGRPTRDSPPPDIFAGLTFTDDQQAKIDQIRRNAKSHQEAVAKDTKLSPETKEAMLHGYRRIENSAIFDVLTPVQKQEVRKRISAWRTAAQQGHHQSQQRPQLPQNETHPQ